jgi:signal recognition particle receptor subunit beta
MVSINYSSREVCCKIVYYGPGLSGKTTNLQYVHSKVPTNTRGKLISLATEADRTLYFDFLPINIGAINGFAAKFQLYTVPGQVYYNATRKLVLRGVDGIVFVADSQPDKMEENIESLVNLEENLKEYGYNINSVPLVIQYNKRDLPGVMSVGQLNAKLNSRDWPFFESSATIGNGVFDTLKLIIKLVLEKAKSTNASKPRPAKVESRTPVVAASGLAAASASGPSAASESRPEKPLPVTVAAGMPPVPDPAEVPGLTTPPESPPVARTPEAPSAETTDFDASERSAMPASYQYRPYPGSVKEKDSQRKTSPTAFSSVQREETAEASIGQKLIKPDSADKEDPLPRAGTPFMAPAIRRRSRKKRRGFFKRLFGIK